MNAAELTADYARGMHAEFGVSRNDGQYMHTADIKGCLIAVRARLQGKPMIAPSAQLRTLWQLGHAGESIMARALTPQLVAKGYTVETDVLMWMSVFGERVWSGRLDRAQYPAKLVTATGQHLIPARTIVGHADLIASRVEGGRVDSIVLEAKTEKRKLQPVPAWGHTMQAATYAIMHAGEAPLGSCVVGMIDRRDGEYLFVDVDVAKVRAEILTRAQAVLAVYAADPPAGTEPPAAWMCSYCDHGGCALNTNKERESLEGIF